MGSGFRTEKDRFLAALYINIIVFVSELLVGWSSRSLSLTADGFHALLHVLTSVVALISVIGFLYYSEAQVKKWAFKINVAMFFPLAIVIAYEAFRRLQNPEIVSLTSLFFIVAIGGLAANCYTVKILDYKNESGEASMNQRAFYRHMLYDVIGSIIVIAGAITIKLTGWYMLDPIASFILALIIIRGAVEMASESHEHHVH